MSAEPAQMSEFDVGQTIVAADSSQFLTFVMADEEYAIDILRVQEIKGWESVTKIPNTPHYVRGVLNLRGTVVPIIDLRARFGLDEVEYGPTTVNIPWYRVQTQHEGPQSRLLIQDYENTEIKKLLQNQTDRTKGNLHNLRCLYRW